MIDWLIDWLIDQDQKLNKKIEKDNKLKKILAICWLTKITTAKETEIWST